MATRHSDAKFLKEINGALASFLDVSDEAEREKFHRRIITRITRYLEERRGEEQTASAQKIPKHQADYVVAIDQPRCTTRRGNGTGEPVA